MLLIYGSCGVSLTLSGAVINLLSTVHEVTDTVCGSLLTF